MIGVATAAGATGAAMAGVKCVAMVGVATWAAYEIGQVATGSVLANEIAGVCHAVCAYGQAE